MKIWHELVCLLDYNKTTPLWTIISTIGLLSRAEIKDIHTLLKIYLAENVLEDLLAFMT